MRNKERPMIPVIEELPLMAVGLVGRRPWRLPARFCGPCAACFVSPGWIGPRARSMAGPRGTGQSA
jgi:hypothetical protein